MQARALPIKVGVRVVPVLRLTQHDGIGVRVDRARVAEHQRAVKGTVGVVEVERHDVGEAVVRGTGRRRIEVAATLRCVLKHAVDALLFHGQPIAQDRVLNAGHRAIAPCGELCLDHAALVPTTPRVHVFDLRRVERRRLEAALDHAANGGVVAARRDVAAFDVQLARDAGCAGAEVDLRDLGERRTVAVVAAATAPAVAVRVVVGVALAVAVDRRVDERAAVVNEHLARLALDADRVVDREVGCGPRVHHQQRAAVEHEDVLPIGLHDVGFVDALNLRRSVGVIRGNAPTSGSTFVAAVAGDTRRCRATKAARSTPSAVAG